MKIYLAMHPDDNQITVNEMQELIENQKHECVLRPKIVRHDSTAVFDAIEGCAMVLCVPMSHRPTEIDFDILWAASKNIPVIVFGNKTHVHRMVRGLEKHVSFAETEEWVAMFIRDIATKNKPPKKQYRKDPDRPIPLSKNGKKLGRPRKYLPSPSLPPIG